MRKRTCKSRKSWLLTVGALLLAASVGFGVPLAFRKWQDDRRLSVVETEKAPEVRITSQTELSIVEKAELFLSAGASTTVLEKGKNYDVPGSLAKAEEEAREAYDAHLKAVKEECAGMKAQAQGHKEEAVKRIIGKVVGTGGYC